MTEEVENDKKGEALREYRGILISLQQTSQQNYDKTILILSGGGLGLTITFIKEIAKQPIDSPCYILLAWICWIISLASNLISHYTSTQAMEFAIKQVDDETIASVQPGGKFDKATGFLNLFSGVTFLAGVVVAILFSFNNLQ